MDRKRMVLAAAALAVPLLAAGAALADVVYLKSGRKFEGAVEEKGDQVILRLERGSFTFPKADVDRVEKSTPPWEVYEQKAKALAPGDVTGHLDLAKWCKANGLSQRMRKEFEQVILFEPDNEEARAGLGHKQIGGKWRTPEEQQPAPPVKEPGKDPAKDPAKPAGPAPPPDGTYKGASRGYADDVEVEVVVALGQIAEVKVTSAKEVRPLGAIKDMPARIVEKQTSRADAVTNATITSTAIKRAVEKALASAGPASPAQVRDGTHTGVSRGAKGDVTVQVAVKGGRITAVGVSAHSESRPGTAIEEVPARIVAAQATEVDAVTGATVTSRAIIRAAQSALDDSVPRAFIAPRQN